MARMLPVCQQETSVYFRIFLAGSQSHAFFAPPALTATWKAIESPKVEIECQQHVPTRPAGPLSTRPQESFARQVQASNSSGSGGRFPGRQPGAERSSRRLALLFWTSAHPGSCRAGFANDASRPTRDARRATGARSPARFLPALHLFKEPRNMFASRFRRIRSLGLR